MSATYDQVTQDLRYRVAVLRGARSARSIAQDMGVRREVVVALLKGAIGNPTLETLLAIESWCNRQEESAHAQ